MQLDQLLATAAHQEDLMLPQSWAQGRAIFGGLVAGLMVSRAEQLVNDSNKMLRSAFVSFVGPVASGAATLSAQILRQGKSVVSIQVHLIQDGQVQSVLVASFGAARDSIIEVLGSHTAPQFKHPSDCQPLPYIAGMTPEFFQHFDVVWSEGSLPFTSAKQPDFGGWMRFKSSENIAQVTLPHLMVLGDTWPPAVLPMFTSMAPASSLNWNLELINMPTQAVGDSWWQYQVKTEYAADGYGYTQAKIWDEQGTLVALSRQTVTVFL